MTSRPKHSTVGLTSSFGVLTLGSASSFGSTASLSSVSSGAASAAARLARAEAARQPTAQNHARRKADDAILADLEKEIANTKAAQAAAQTAADGGSGGGHSHGEEDKHGNQAGRKKEEGERRRDRNAAPATSLPREDAHRFRATVRRHIHAVLAHILTSGRIYSQPT